jgi:hypothetical protein
MARERAGRWPYITDPERRQLVITTIDLEEHHGIRANQADLVRAALRMALRDFTTLGGRSPLVAELRELRSETPPPA